MAARIDSLIGSHKDMSNAVSHEIKTGYGLGLAIVRRIAEWHGGDAAVAQSSLGGAGFCIRWPAARSRQAQ